MKRREFLEQTTHLGAAAAFVALGGAALGPQTAAAADKPKPGQWPFGLSAAEEQRAAKLHEESIIIDMVFQGAGGMNIFDHYDPALIDKYTDHKLKGIDHVFQVGGIPDRLALEGKSDLIKQWWQMSGLTASGFGITPAYPSKDLDAQRKEAMEIFKMPWMRFVKTAAEIRKAKKDGVFANYGSCQPVAGLPPDITTIDDAYKAGLRVLMLTYNRMDYVGGGCTERIDVGLSTYGVEVVKRCNELGIVVDTAHCGKQTTLDACKFSKKPVLATHSSAEGVYYHARAKSDEELKALADSGGVIGVVVLPAFLTNKPNPTLDVFLDHIDYIARKVGWQHVGLGSDHPIQTTRKLAATELGPAYAKIGFRPEDGILSGVERCLGGYEDGRDLPNITRGLVKRGYTDEQIHGILGGNVLRVFEKVWV